MTGGVRAEDRLQRLLYILPAAGGAEGADLGELAGLLGTDEARIMEDVTEVTKRTYYHPGGWPDDIVIELSADRIRVVHDGGLTRPPRLTEREMLCLAMALRGTRAATHLTSDEERLALLRRVEAHLRVPRREGAPGGASGGARDRKAGGAALPDEPGLAAPDHDPDAGGHLETLIQAARDRRPCAILYVKPGAADAEARVIHPFAMVASEGAWYAVGHCCVRDAVRAFRVDRVLHAATTDGTFDVPTDFDAEAYVEGGKLYRSDEGIEVRVRYAPTVARWIRERAAFGMASLVEQDDGSVVATHQVADPHWAVAHVLHYGADAEIVEPAPYRALVRDAMARITG